VDVPDVDAHVWAAAVAGGGQGLPRGGEAAAPGTGADSPAACEDSTPEQTKNGRGEGQQRETVMN